MTGGWGPAGASQGPGGDDTGASSGIGGGTAHFSPTSKGPTLTSPGLFKDHHYPMVYAGVDAFGSIGDPREALGTLWYHDHRVDFTAPNTYLGLVGMFLAFDEWDSGNELDQNRNALRLPSGDFDIPLVIADKQFDSSGNLFFDPFNTDGMLGDKYTVNGKIQPYLHVARRKYRFRLLDAGPSRFYEFQLHRNNSSQSFLYIANDGNLLPAPLRMNTVRLAPAERADIVIDFSRYRIGDELYLVNRLQQLDGRGPSNNLLRPAHQLLKFVVDRDAPDPNRVPDRLRELPLIDRSRGLTVRRWVFDRENGQWAINGRLFDYEDRRAAIKKGSGEIWVLSNPSGGWSHPIHIHFEEGQVLSRNGKPPLPHKRGRKDVYVLGPNEEVRLFMRFRDFMGKYVMHCHNTVHEDHAMMLQWDIVD